MTSHQILLYFINEKKIIHNPCLSRFFCLFVCFVFLSQGFSLAVLDLFYLAFQSQASLELTRERSPSVCLLSARIKDVLHHTWLTFSVLITEENDESYTLFVKPLHRIRTRLEIKMETGRRGDTSTDCRNYQLSVYEEQGQHDQFQIQPNQNKQLYPPNNNNNPTRLYPGFLPLYCGSGNTCLESLELLFKIQVSRIHCRD